MEPEILHGEFDTLLLDNSSGQEGRKRRKTVLSFISKYLLFIVISVFIVVTIYCCISIQKVIRHLRDPLFLLIVDYSTSACAYYEMN